MTWLSSEQIVLLIILVGIPLARAVLRRLRRPDPVARPVLLREEPGELEEADVPFPAAASPGLSAPPSLRESHPAGPVPAKSSPARRRRQTSGQLPPEDVRGQTAVVSARAILRANKAGLHQAVVLMTIIGSPRAVDPY